MKNRKSEKEKMQELNRYKRKRFNRYLLPVSAFLVVGIGFIFSIVIFIEEGWHWHTFAPPPIFGLWGGTLYWIYKKGNEIIEIAQDSISIISGSHVKKTLDYSEISALIYTYVQGYTPPTIKLKGENCIIEFDGDLENYHLAVKRLFHYFIQKGRNDLIEAYNQQFKKEHGVKKRH